MCSVRSARARWRSAVRQARAPTVHVVAGKPAVLQPRRRLGQRGAKTFFVYRADRANSFAQRRPARSRLSYFYLLH
jgi:hypothetical protein